MVSPISLDLSYVDLQDHKKQNNVNAIKIIERNINASGDIFSEAKLINQACLQFDIMSRHDTEARTHSWSRIGCLVSHVRERYEQAPRSYPDIPSWSKFSELYFNGTIGERRIEQVQMLYNYEKQFKDITKIYFLGIDRIVPLFNALYLKHAQGQVRYLLEKFDINLRDRTLSKQDLSILNKKIDALTKYLNTSDTIGELSYDKELMFSAVKVGCVFDNNDTKHMQSLGSSEEINEYLRRCIANKGFNRVQRNEENNYESIHCILSKLIETINIYNEKSIPIPAHLEISEVDQALRYLAHLSREMHKRRSK